jgi:hypothetical protein
MQMLYQLSYAPPPRRPGYIPVVRRGVLVGEDSGSDECRSGTRGGTMHRRAPAMRPPYIRADASESNRRRSPSLSWVSAVRRWPASTARSPTKRHSHPCDLRLRAGISWHARASPGVGPRVQIVRHDPGARGDPISASPRGSGQRAGGYAATEVHGNAAAITEPIGAAVG